MPQLASRLLVVTDRHQTKGRPLLSVLQQVLAAGAPAIQLRERDLPLRDFLTLARELRAMTGPARSQLLINDRLDVALALEDAGVHLRSNSLPVAVARRFMGAQRVLGVSAHSLREVEQAEAEGADYVVLGPIYETPSKQSFGPPLGLAALGSACRLVKIPLLGIGGITPARAREVRNAGAFGVAAIGAILGAQDCAAATRAMLDAVSS